MHREEGRGHGGGGRVTGEEARQRVLRGIRDRDLRPTVRFAGIRVPGEGCLTACDLREAQVALPARHPSLDVAELHGVCPELGDAVRHVNHPQHAAAGFLLNIAGGGNTIPEPAGTHDGGQEVVVALIILQELHQARHALARRLVEFHLHVPALGRGAENVLDQLFGVILRQSVRRVGPAVAGEAGCCQGWLQGDAVPVGQGAALADAQLLGSIHGRDEPVDLQQILLICLKSRGCDAEQGRLSQEVVHIQCRLRADRYIILEECGECLPSGDQSQAAVAGAA